MRKTSTKAFTASFVFWIVGLVFVAAADLVEKYESIRFSGGHRPWNSLDYAWIASFVLAASFVAVALMFVQKDD